MRLSNLIAFIFAVFVLMLAGTVQPARAAELSEDALWRMLVDGEAVALLRHASAPGFGDPDHFELGDCSTQRNLSQAGREQARRIGDRFRQHGITHAVVRSSQWCRTLDTARLLDLGGRNADAGAELVLWRSQYESEPNAKGAQPDSR